MMKSAEDNGSPLSGKRILLVEDDFLIASSLAQSLRELGLEVVGPVPSLDEARRLAEDEHLCGAILDINILGGPSFPVAEALHQRGCPFIFITGYGSPQGLPPSLARARRLNKPIDEADFKEVVSVEFLGEA